MSALGDPGRLAAFDLFHKQTSCSGLAWWLGSSFGGQMSALGGLGLLAAFDILHKQTSCSGLAWWLGSRSWWSDVCFGWSGAASDIFHTRGPWHFS